MRYFSRLEEKGEESRLESEGGVEVRHSRHNDSVAFKIDHAVKSVSWHLVGDGDVIESEPFHVNGPVSDTEWSRIVGGTRAASKMVLGLDKLSGNRIGWLTN